MELKFIDNPVRLQAFLNDPAIPKILLSRGTRTTSSLMRYISASTKDWCWLAFMKCVTSGIALLNAMRCTTPDSVVNMHCKGIDYSANGFSKTHHSLTASLWFLTPRNTDGQLSVCLALPVLVTLMMLISDVVNPSA